MIWLFPGQAWVKQRRAADLGSSFDRVGPMTDTTTTIKKLAEKAKARLIVVNGIDGYSEMCQKFARQLTGSSPYLRYVSALRLMDKAGMESSTVQIGICWLEEHRFGDRTVEWLEMELKRVR